MRNHARRTLVPTVVCILLVAGGAAWAGAPDPTAAAKAVPEPDITFVEDEDNPDASTAGSPFAPTKEAVYRKDAVPGYIELSDGTRRAGRIYTTRAKRLKIYNLKREIYEFVPVPACKRIEGVVEWERLDKEWRFKEAGNPEKVYTGRAYPLRMHAWRLTLRNDHEILGHILGQPVYVLCEGKAERFILHKRDKGPMGAKLEDLVYVRRIVLGPEAYNEALEMLKVGEANGAAKEGQ
ncbi:MAG TPA: hypothetical protein VM238_08475 [Phycisphaerae bacterium]|nr:hypothetical protein [Phycisphaerae bacterium]